MIGIWSEDDWPLPGDTVKQTNNNKKINDKPKTKKTITVPAQGLVGVRISSDEEDRIWAKVKTPQKIPGPEIYLQKIP